MRWPRTGLRRSGLYGPPSPTLETFRICSPRGFGYTLSCSKLRSGNRGALAGADWSPAIAANPPSTPAAIPESALFMMLLLTGQAALPNRQPRAIDESTALKRRHQRLHALGRRGLTVDDGDPVLLEQREIGAPLRLPLPEVLRLRERHIIGTEL